jgi:hypothetical protein
VLKNLTLSSIFALSSNTTYFFFVSIFQFSSCYQQIAFHCILHFILL